MGPSLDNRPRPYHVDSSGNEETDALSPMPSWGEPYLVMHLVWHPDSSSSAAAARRLADHFARDRFPVEEPHGLAVFEWSAPSPPSSAPPPLVFHPATVHAVIALIDGQVEADPAWSQYIHDLAAHCAHPPASRPPQLRRLIPVAMASTPGSLATSLGPQALRWHKWPGNRTAKISRLIRETTYAAARLLRAAADHDFNLSSQMQPVRVFLSHSKHDRAGQRAANAVRTWLSNDVQLHAFLDVFDVPAGLPADDTLDEGIRQSAVVAIHTDSFSSREWCRREVLLAKEARRPLVVVDCVDQLDERAYAYLGNVPLVRLNPRNPRRVGPVVQLLLDEVFKDFLWHSRTASFAAENPDIDFIASPPELLTLATAARRRPAPSRIVYPDPPLGVRESLLLTDFGPPIQTIGQWLTDTRA